MMRNLTPADDRAILEAIGRDKSQTALRKWIRKHTGVLLPNKIFTPGHSSPMAFVAEAFFNPGRDVAAWACRSGGKTLGASILALLEFTVNDGLQARVLSGSEDQAKNLYQYWRQWCQGPLAWRVVGDVKRTETSVGGGMLQILAASQKKVRGGKVQRLYEDELDEIDVEIDDAAAGMIDSRDGMPGRTIYTSTWHHVGGTMAKLIDGARAPVSDGGNGVSLHQWNLWEAIEHCRPERHDNGNGCESCALGPTCVSQARQYHSEPRRRIGIAADACGIYRIDDACKAARKVSETTWEAEYLCQRPSVDGLVYPQFDRRIHVRPALDFDDALPTYRAIDWGINTFVCLWIQEDKGGQVYVVDEMWAEDATVADNARAIKAKDRDVWPPLKVEATFCDPAGRSRNDQTGISDVDVVASILGTRPRFKVDGWSTALPNGIGVIRGALKPAVGKPRIFVAGACKMLIRAFESYRNRKVNGQYIDDPVKPQPMDHGVDALRYYYVNRHRRGGDKFVMARNA